MYAGVDEASAESIVPLVMEAVAPRSVADIGCGRGLWLSAFERHGVAEYRGVDGDSVRPEWLTIPRERFQTADLTQPLRLERPVDLVVCLEVAEHLPAEHARTLVDTLTAAGDVVLFSAAIPHQGGVGHLNERWPDYWVDLFGAAGFVPVDYLRPRIWRQERVAFWYRQNIVLFVRDGRLDDYPLLRAALESAAPDFLPVVHPDLWEQRNAEVLNLRPVIGDERADRLDALKTRLGQWVKGRVAR